MQNVKKTTECKSECVSNHTQRTPISWRSRYAYSTKSAGLLSKTKPYLPAVAAMPCSQLFLVICNSCGTGPKPWPCPPWPPIYPNLSHNFVSHKWAKIFSASQILRRDFAPASRLLKQFGWGVYTALIELMRTEAQIYATKFSKIQYVVWDLKGLDQDISSPDQGVCAEHQDEAMTKPSISLETEMSGPRVASIRISNGSLVYYDHYTKLHIVARPRDHPWVRVLCHGICKKCRNQVQNVSTHWISYAYLYS